MAVALPAHAAKAPEISDPAGDANLLNDQSFGASVPEQSTPVDLSAADITKVDLATTKKGRKVTGFTITMTLSAAPTVPDVFYRVSASTASCGTLFFEYSTSPTTAGGSARCVAELPTDPSKAVKLTSVVVKGSSVVWTVPVKSIPKGSSLANLDGQTRFTAGAAGRAVTAPQFDYASSAATFTVGK